MSLDKSSYIFWIAAFLNTAEVFLSYIKALSS